MPGVPGLRTNPTVKPLATMNAQRVRSWEVRLGAIQLVMLVGVVVGSLVSAFYLGAWSGQKAGFDLAGDVARSSMPKEVIIDAATSREETSDVDGGQSSKREVFDNLKETSSTEHLTPSGDLTGASKALDSSTVDNSNPNIAITRGKDSVSGKLEVGEEKSPSATAFSVAREQSEGWINGPASRGAAVLAKAAPAGQNSPGHSSEELPRLVGEPLKLKQIPGTAEANGNANLPGSNRGGPTIGSIVKGGDPSVNLPKSANGVKTGISESKPTKQLASPSIPATDRQQLVNAPMASATEISNAKAETTSSIQRSARKTEVGELQKFNGDASGRSASKADVSARAVKSDMAVSNGTKDESKGEGVPNSAKNIGALASGSWYVQISAPRSISEANDLISKLGQSGFKGAIERATVNGDEYYRVVAGPEKTKELAERLRDQLKREKSVKGSPFVRFVK